MERLTVKWKERLYDTFDPIDVDDNEYSKINYQKLINKLGQYEDAEEQGLLLRLPVAVGSTVYHYCGDFGVILPYTISSICISSFLSGGIDIVIEGGAYGEDEVLDDFSECLVDFQKSFFLTEKEAEQALKRMESE